MPAQAKPQKARMDIYLKEVLEKADPEEKLYVIVVFHQQPTEKQLALLASEGIEITHKYMPLINAVAGRLSAKYINKLRQYEFIKDLELSGGANL